MKPGFALSLSFDGIALLHRAAGGWRQVGEVMLDSPDMAGELAALRERAGRIVPGDLHCKVVLPNSQIRYLTLQTGRADESTRRDLAQAALEGATPYAVDELAFDLSPDGPQTHIAAVARETLNEAEAFAVEHGFHPVSFVAIPGEMPFLGEPFFGQTRHAEKLGIETPVELDGISVVVIGPANIPDVPAPAAAPIVADAPSGIPVPGEVAKDTAPPADALPIDAPAAEQPDRAAPQDPPAMPGFSSRRSATADRAPDPATKPTLAEASRETQLPSGAPELGSAPAVTVPDTAAGNLATAPHPRKGQAGKPAVAKPVSPRPKPGSAEPSPGTVARFMSRRETPVDPPPDLPRAPAPLAEPVAPQPDAPIEAPAKAEQPQGSTRTGLVAATLSKLLSRKTLSSAEPDLSSAAFATAANKPEQVTPLPASEAERMTIFGARNTKVGGKPRHLGLMLTVALILFLLMVAAWAAVFGGDVVTRLFGTPDETELAAEPEPLDPAFQPEDAPALVETPPETLRPLPAEPTEPALSTLPDPLSEPTEDLAGLADGMAAPLEDTTGPAEDMAPEPEAVDPIDLAIQNALSEPAPLTPPEVEARYAATGIWQNAPDVPAEPGIVGLDDLYLVSIDRTDLSQDAFALPPAASFETDAALAAPNSPAAAGTAFALDPEGLVQPSPEGAITPDGVVVYQGPPPVRPPATPDRPDPQADIDAQQAALGAVRPRPRPADLVEQNERSQLGGRSREELGQSRPRLRPDNLKPAADAETAPEIEDTATALAVAASRLPKSRPASLKPVIRSPLAAAAPKQVSPLINLESDDEPEQTVIATVAPRVPSSASVARQATVNNAINLGRINLIGVYGTPSNRRALIRLPTGRYKKVKVGDRVDGGKVLAIGESELHMQKDGRSVTLKIPKS